jgi:adenosyl cobinamide kinase/adenosyl cobinamide phosphate guanylyltransferase
VRKLVLGPPGSGKSLFAESSLVATGDPLCYFATLPNRRETEVRIARHVARRDQRWVTYEAGRDPFDDLRAVSELAGTGRALLLDGIGSWLAQLWPDRAVRHRFYDLCSSLCNVLSSRELSWIVVDADPEQWRAARPYGLADVLHSFHAMIATHARCDVVHLAERGLYAPANPVD